MNYIKQLEQDNAALRAALKRVDGEICSFLFFLNNSPKFSGTEIVDGKQMRKDWISTGDVVNRLIDFRNAAIADTIRNYGRIETAELNTPDLPEPRG